MPLPDTGDAIHHWPRRARPPAHACALSAGRALGKAERGTPFGAPRTIPPHRSAAYIPHQPTVEDDRSGPSGIAGACRSRPADLLPGPVAHPSVVPVAFRWVPAWWPIQWVKRIGPLPRGAQRVFHNLRTIPAPVLPHETHDLRGCTGPDKQQIRTATGRGYGDPEKAVEGAWCAGHELGPARIVQFNRRL